MISDSGLVVEGTSVDDGNPMLAKVINTNGSTEWFLWGDNVYKGYSNVVIEKTATGEWNAYTFVPDTENPINMLDKDSWTPIEVEVDFNTPRFITADYIELDKINEISKFRSGIGHNYSDAYETCRSMKHYFEPKADVDWSSIKIFSPVDGTITNFFQEQVGGTQIWIRPTSDPEYEVRIFHVNLDTSLKIGDTVTSGQQLGTHIGSQTTSDIAVATTSDGQWRLVSYFDVMTEEVFVNYLERGITSPDDMIISKEARDADPLSYIPGTDIFATGGTISNWGQLNDHPIDPGQVNLYFSLPELGTWPQSGVSVEYPNFSPIYYESGYLACEKVAVSLNITPMKIITAPVKGVSGILMTQSIIDILFTITTAQRP